MRRWRAPVGVRLAAVTALLVLGVGTALLAASYWLLMVRLPDSFVVDVTGAAVQVPVGAVEPQTYVVEVGGTVAEALPPVSARQIVASAVEDTAAQYEAQLRNGFARQAGVLLLALTVPAVAVGGFAARRALRPVHAMSAAARGLGAGSLRERLPADGPRDELRELAETFNAMLDRVEAGFDRERRLMANVSHELRTPLANQHVALEVGLEDDTATTADLRRVAATALEQNRRARHLIEEILVLARAEQDAHPDGDENTDLADAARHAVDAVGALPDAAPGLDVRVDLATAPALGRPVLLERLVGNLVENAVRHNVPGGFVAVSTRAVDGVARVQVENSGPVVPADAVDGLFEPFRRGAGDRVRSDRGTGLGLSVVASVVRRYGGRVEAAARPDGGLHVVVTLPGPLRNAVQPDLHARVPVQAGEIHPIDA